MDLGITVCEDAWQAAGLTPVDYGVDPVAQLAALVRQDATLSATVNLSASPFHHRQGRRPHHGRSNRCRPFGHAFPVGQPSRRQRRPRVRRLVHRGVARRHGRARSGMGRRCAHRRPERSVLLHVDALQRRGCPLHRRTRTPCVASGPSRTDRDGSRGLVDAVVTGLADYCRKSGLHRIVLGLSGGIDSAVAACVAVEALGPEAVHGLALPSRHSSCTAVTMRVDGGGLGHALLRDPLGRHARAGGDPPR